MRRGQHPWGLTQGWQLLLSACDAVAAMLVLRWSWPAWACCACGKCCLRGKRLRELLYAAKLVQQHEAGAAQKKLLHVNDAVLLSSSEPVLFLCCSVCRSSCATAASAPVCNDRSQGVHAGHRRERAPEKTLCLHINPPAPTGRLLIAAVVHGAGSTATGYPRTLRRHLLMR